MLYLAKKFHRQQNFINRCLNGFVISLCFVVMNGCENIRYNTISESGNKTLFYLASSSEVTLPPDKPRLLDSKFNQVHKDIEQTTVDIVEVDSNESPYPDKNRLEGEVVLETNNKPLDPIQIDSSDNIALVKQEDESFTLNKGFSDWLSSFFSAELEDDSLNEDTLVFTNPDALINSDEDTILVEKDKTQETSSVPLLSSAQEIAKINALNESEPAAAGQTPTLLASEKSERYEQRINKAMSRQLKSAIKAASLEIFQWQLEANNSLGCQLSSPTIQLDNPDYTTQLWFNIEENRLIVNATTDINTSLPLVGLYFENGHHEQFSSRTYSNNVTWEGNIVDLLNENKIIKLVIGGTDLQSKIQLAAINLASLKAIYPRFQSCAKRLLGRAE